MFIFHCLQNTDTIHTIIWSFSKQSDRMSSMIHCQHCWPESMNNKSNMMQNSTWLKSKMIRLAILVQMQIHRHSKNWKMSHQMKSNKWVGRKMMIYKCAHAWYQNFLKFFFFFVLKRKIKTNYKQNKLKTLFHLKLKKNV